MDMDIKIKRASFIKNSTDIRDMFSFALPSQVLTAVKVYSAHFYGAPLWDLYGDLAGQVYRCWNTCVKQVWDLPRSTHNFFVESLQSENLTSVRNDIFSQYIGFLGRLGRSVSEEVRIMSVVAGSDIRSTVGRNVSGLKGEFGLDPWCAFPRQFKRSYILYETPEEDKWRLPLLQKLLSERYEMSVCGEDVHYIQGLIESLCSS